MNYKETGCTRPSFFIGTRMKFLPLILVLLQKISLSSSSFPFASEQQQEQILSQQLLNIIVNNINTITNNSNNNTTGSKTTNNNNNNNNNNNDDNTPDTRSCGEICGWLAAFCAMLAFGTFGVPIKSKAAISVNVDPLVFQSYKTFVCFITSWIVLLCTGEQFTFTPWGIVSGLFWVPGGVATIYAVKAAGLAIGIGIGSSFIVLVSFVWGIFIFNERVHSRIGACFAILCMMFGLIGMSYYSSPIPTTTSSSSSSSSSSTAIPSTSSSSSSNPHSAIINVEDDDEDGVRSMDNNNDNNNTTNRDDDLMNGLRHDDDNTHSSSRMEAYVVNPARSNGQHPISFYHTNDSEEVKKHKIHNNERYHGLVREEEVTITDALDVRVVDYNTAIIPCSNNIVTDTIQHQQQQQQQEEQQPISTKTYSHLSFSDYSSRSYNNNGYIDDQSSIGSPGSYHQNHQSRHHHNVDNHNNNDDCENSGLYACCCGYLHLTKRQLGMLAAAFCGIYGGSILAPMKFANTNTKGTHYLISFAIGASIVTIGLWIIRFMYNSFLYGSFYIGYKVLPSFHVRVMWLAGGISGLLWSIGNYFSLISVLYLGEGVGYPLVQTSILISGLWGILYFKEVQGFDRISKWFLSSLLTISGIIILSYEHHEK